MQCRQEWRRSFLYNLSQGDEPLKEFDCKKYLCDCEAKCCGPVPFEKKLYDDNKEKIVNPAIEIIEFEAPNLPDGKIESMDI